MTRNTQRQSIPKFRYHSCFYIHAHTYFKRSKHNNWSRIEFQGHLCRFPFGPINGKRFEMLFQIHIFTLHRKLVVLIACSFLIWELARCQEAGNQIKAFGPHRPIDVWHAITTSYIKREFFTLWIIITMIMMIIILDQWRYADW